MKKLWALVSFLLLVTPAVWADTQDTTVFKANMSPDNEIPVISAPGVSGLAVVTVRVTRDAATANINAATVIFDIDYTVPGPTTFTGLHIHNALPGASGGVVINTGLSAANSISANGTGHITRVVNYSSTDTDGLKYVTGLLDTPENYYVNIHSSAQPSGLMRAPTLRTSITLRPQLTPQQVVPIVTPAIDAEGAAAIQIVVNRNNAGAITSGIVIFDVDYRLAPGATITGLGIYNAATGANGPLAIDTSINGAGRQIVAAAGRGNIFRSVDIVSSNAAGLAALTGLMNDPAQFYVNLQTSGNSGIIRGQLSKDAYAFFNLMTAAEEVPPTATGATANSMTLVRVARDPLVGNIVTGTVGFNVGYSGFGGPITFTGLHIHNGAAGIAGGVVINTGIGGTNTVSDDDGIGSVSRDVIVDGANATALTALRGLLQNPELYYVNIHTTVNTGGAIRAQLYRETYHYKTAMTAANEVPVVSSAISATGWITEKVFRDPGTAAIIGGQVTFDVDVTGEGSPVTFTGLHIHSGSAAVAGPVVINTGLSAASPVESPSGTLNITRVVNIDPANAVQLTMLGTLINSPDQAYVNIHTSVFPGGVARSQMLPVLNYVPQLAGGGDWISSITITNPSTTVSVQGIVDAYSNNGSAISAAFVDPNMSFLIPPGGSTTVNLHNKGALTTGYMRVYSSGNVTLSAKYSFPDLAATATVVPVTASIVSIPVTVGGGQDTGIALFNITGGTLILTLRNPGAIGTPIAGGSATIPVTARQHVVGFVKDLIPSAPSTPFSGVLTIENRPDVGPGQLSAIALQFDGTLAPVSITPIQ